MKKIKFLENVEFCIALNGRNEGAITATNVFKSSYQIVNHFRSHITAPSNAYGQWK